MILYRGRYLVEAPAIFHFLAIGSRIMPISAVASSDRALCSAKGQLGHRLAPAHVRQVSLVIGQASAWRTHVPAREFEPRGGLDLGQVSFPLTCDLLLGRARS